jgi:AraC-like DNA-binding protein
MPDLIVCKQDLPGMTGSELCNKIKMSITLYKIRFVLLTDTKLSQKDMMAQEITMSADDYLSKPFNLQEAVMRFNKLLGIESFDLGSNLIEGAETRMLEDRNSSMTTATESIDYGNIDTSADDSDDEEIRAVTIKRIHQDTSGNSLDIADAELKNDSWSMTDVMDQRLLMSIEQYVQQNMSRGQISLDEMASSMGMSLRPFFQKVNELTGKTPAEVVRDLRLKNACVLLKRTNINMTELASNVGFATGEHFINIFKERFGISPTEYRQKYRRPNAGL